MEKKIRFKQVKHGVILFSSVICDSIAPPPLDRPVYSQTLLSLLGVSGDPDETIIADFPVPASRRVRSKIYTIDTPSYVLGVWDIRDASLSAYNPKFSPFPIEVAVIPIIENPRDGIPQESLLRGQRDVAEVPVTMIKLDNLDWRLFIVSIRHEEIPTPPEQLVSEQVLSYKPYMKSYHIDHLDLFKHDLLRLLEQGNLE